MKRWLLILTLGVAWCRAVGGADAPGNGEYLVKATCLLNFAKFIEWPAGTFASPDAPLIIGVLGEDPFVEDLDDAIKAQKTINGRALVARRSEELSALGTCQIVFIRLTDARRLGTALDRLRGTAVLTVGESADFLEQGGMIKFNRREAKVRFQISDPVAKKAGLKIDSRLLGLAEPVKGRGEERKP